jgi:hypothetical protein
VRRHSCQLDSLIHGHQQIRGRRWRGVSGVARWVLAEANSHSEGVGVDGWDDNEGR